jgi:hypothetical protein
MLEDFDRYARRMGTDKTPSNRGNTLIIEEKILSIIAEIFATI